MGDDASQTPGLNAAGAAVMDRYGTAMSCDQIFKKKPSVADLRGIIEKLPTEWVVRVCGFLECLRDEPQRLGIDIHSLAIEAFAPGPLRKDLLAHYKETGDQFLFEEQVLGLIRLAILIGQDEIPPILLPEQFGSFFWALMYYGDLHSAEIGEIEEPEHAARMELRGLAFGATEVPGNVMARAYALWLDLPNRTEIAQSTYFVDVGYEFAHANEGSAIEDHFTVVSAALTHRVDVMTDGVEASLARWPFDPASRFASSARAVDLTNTMRTFAANRAELRQIIDKEMPPIPQFLGVAMIPFVHRPLYASVDGTFLIISMRLMLDGLYDLAYWRMWEHLKLQHGDQGQVLSERFTQFYGQILERYVVELLQSVYDADGNKRVFAEAEATPAEGAADAAIFLDDRVLLIEVTKTDVRYFETLLKGDLDNFQVDFARTADKAAQIVKAEQRFRSGQVTYTGHEADTKLPVERILVVPSPIARFPFINQYTDAALRQVGLGPDATIISIGELEEALVAGDLKGLSGTIEAWKKSEFADMALHNYIRIKTPVIPMQQRAPYLNECAQKLRKLVIERMGFKKDETGAN